MAAALAVVGAAVAVVSASALAQRGSSGRAAAGRGCSSPYARWSPWNTPIVNGAYAPDSASRVGRIQGGKLSSDPTQYTYPVYYVGKGTPSASVRIDGSFSFVTRRGIGIRNADSTTVHLPIPNGAHAAEGSDGQIIMIDRASGDEWGFWQFDGSGGSYHATNGYHYNVRWSGVPPHRFVSRGAGVPYLTGLVRPCEIKRGRIDHAIAFAYPNPSGEHTYPATKSDGGGGGGDIPEGGRLQLDPTISAARIRSWGCRNACFTIARALQRYGMYVIDNSGRPKIMMEYEDTAHWHGLVSAKTPNPIPLSAFKLVVNTNPTAQALPSTGNAGTRVRLRYSTFARGDATREIVTVSSLGHVVGRVRRTFHVPLAQQQTSVLWRARHAGVYTFCVQSFDPAGHTSGSSCAPLTVL
jgi:hypothetical protein